MNCKCNELQGFKTANFFYIVDIFKQLIFGIVINYILNTYQ